MALNHRDFSGFFPFYTVPYATELAEGGESDSFDQRLVQSALADLVRLFWSAKDAVITANVPYSYTTTGYPTVFSSLTDEGTLAGSFRASADVASGGVDFYTTYSCMPLPPFARTSTGLPFLSVISPTDGSMTVNGNFTAKELTLVPGSYDNRAAFQATWFNSLTSDTEPSTGNVAFDAGANAYYTRLFLNMSVGGGNRVGLTLNSSSPNVVSGTTLDVQLNGRSVLTSGLLSFYYNPAGLASFTSGGSVVINVDTFWA